MLIGSPSLRGLYLLSHVTQGQERRDFYTYTVLLGPRNHQVCSPNWDFTLRPAGRRVDRVLVSDYHPVSRSPNLPEVRRCQDWPCPQPKTVPSDPIAEHCRNGRSTRCMRPSSLAAMSPGDPISEEEITKRLGVSRSPAREALRELEAVGIVEVNSINGRRVVAKFDASDIYDLYTVRSGLEELGARYAAPKATPELIRQLKALQDQMEQVGSTREYPSRRDFELDFELHRVICRASGLRRLETTLRPLWLQTHACFGTSAP